MAIHHYVYSEGNATTEVHKTKPWWIFTIFTTPSAKEM